MSACTVPRLALSAAVLLTVAACGGDDGHAPAAQPPATLAPSPDMQPLEGALFFDTGTGSLNAKYGGQTMRQWVVIDPNGALATTRAGPSPADPRFVGGAGWSLDGETLVLAREEAAATRHRPAWVHPASGLTLVARPRVDPGFYTRTWQGADPDMGAAGLFTTRLAALLQTCPATGESGRFWWSGSLRIDPDGSYRSALILMRRCTDATGTRDDPIAADHLLERLRGGSWRLSDTGRQMIFTETGGARLTARLDGVQVTPDTPQVRLCVDGALLTTEAAPEVMTALRQARSATPVRTNLPLVLDEDAGCLPAAFDGGRVAPQAWLELLPDGTAVGEGVPGLDPVRPSRWQVGPTELTFPAPANAVGPTTLTRRWAGLNPGPRVDAVTLARGWTARSIAQRGFFGGLTPAEFRWRGTLDLRADGTYTATLSIEASGPGAPDVATANHPLLRLTRGSWTLDADTGTLHLRDALASIHALRVSLELPIVGGSDALVGSETPRIQIESIQFVPAAP